MFKRWFTIAVLVFGVRLLPAQTTQPSLDACNARLDQIVAALPNDGQAEKLAELIPDEISIQQFDNTQTETRFRLAERVNHMSVLWQHSYVGVPTSLVSDLSSELNDPALPASLRKKLVPKDAAAIAKADATAGRWVSRLLTPDPVSAVSIVLFWEKPSDNSAAKEPIFVLLKSRPHGADWSLAQIRYGEMSQALN